jgi:transcription antitermination factor NusG
MDGASANEARGEEYRYGCVFCATGREDDIAADIGRRYPGIETLPVAQMKHRSVNGRRFRERQIMLPGYIFIRTKEDTLPLFLCRTHGVLKILCEDEHKWELSGANQRFSVWVFENRGLLDVSKLFRQGQTIIISDGPLREMRGNIERIDKRNRNCLIRLCFNESVFRVWLPFEYVDENC